MSFVARKKTRSINARNRYENSSIFVMLKQN